MRIALRGDLAKTIQVTVEPGCTISQLRRLVYDSAGQLDLEFAFTSRYEPDDLYAFRFNGQELKKGWETLRQHGVAENAELDILFNKRGPYSDSVIFTIQSAYHIGKESTGINYAETVGTFKQMIRRKTGDQEPALSLNGQALNNDNDKILPLIWRQAEPDLRAIVNTEYKTEFSLNSRETVAPVYSASISGAEQTLWPYLLGGGLIGATAGGVSIAIMLSGTSLATTVLPVEALCTISIAASVIIGVIGGAVASKAISR